MKKYYESHEEFIADAFGGRLTCSSGRHFHSKGDVSVGGQDGLLADCKCTQAPQYRLTYKTWMKIVGEAGNVSKTPALPLRFLDARGKVIRDFVVFPSGDTALPNLAKNSHLIKVNDAPHRFEITSDVMKENGLRANGLTLFELEDFIEYWEKLCH